MFARVSSLYVHPGILAVLSSLGCYRHLDFALLSGLRVCVFWPPERRHSTSLLVSGAQKYLPASLLSAPGLTVISMCHRETLRLPTVPGLVQTSIADLPISPAKNDVFAATRAEIL